MRSVDDLAARVLEEVGGSFSFVGLSLGGAVGMRLARRTPDRVEKLVLAAPRRASASPSTGANARRSFGEGLEVIVDAVLARWY